MIMDEERERLFREKLLSWFSENARSLPWRKDPCLYKTVVSEFMLQQTQVKTVIPFFERWLKCFPDFETLAKSDVSTVIKLWEGLGYYSRAKNLRCFAQHFVQKPAKSFSDLLAFKGIGPYTAAAIASIAFHEKVAVVDGNVIRVLARVFNITTIFPNKDNAVKYITPIAQQLLDPKHPGDFNEAVMELGAVICGKNNPQCHYCPLKDLCGAFQEGTLQQCPQFVQLVRKKVLKKRFWFVNNDCILLEPSRIGGPNTLWELPELTTERARCFLINQLIFTGKRSIGTSNITEEIYSVTCPKLGKRSLKNMEPCTYFPLKYLDEISLSGPHKRWIQQLLNL